MWTEESKKAFGERMKSKYGEDYYSKIGRKGGKNGNTGGFYADRELARRAGVKGGKISKRGKYERSI